MKIYQTGIIRPITIEPLECRIAPAGIILAGGLTDMTVSLFSGFLILSDTSGSVSDATLTVSLNGANIQISDPAHTFSVGSGVTLVDTHTVEVPFSDVITGFNINAADGDDTLFIDYSGGSPLPSGGISFDGGNGVDTLTIGGGSATSTTHTFQSLGNGAFLVGGASISYSNSEDLADTMIVADRILNFAATADTITLTSSSGTLTLLTSDHGITARFVSPSSTLALNSGDGDDAITINSLNPNFLGDFTVNAGLGADVLAIGSILSSKSLTANAETLNPLPGLDLGLFTSNITAGIVSLQTGGVLSYKLSGSGASPSFGQLKISGALDLNGATLTLASTLASLPTSPITLIDLAGVDSTSSRFAGLAEGASLTVSGALFHITYFGGDGNDVALIPIPPTPVGIIQLGDLGRFSGFTIFGKNGGNRLGISVGSAGDVNGDGIDDFILGAHRVSSGSIFTAGAAYIVYGKTSSFPAFFDLGTLDGTNGFKIEGALSEDNLGISVGKAGDVNGDGIADLLVSAPLSNGLGATYVVFGKTGSVAATLNVATLDGTNGFKIQGSSTLDQASHVSSTAGDINGDGVDDIVVGISSAYGSIDSRSGAAYVIYGHKSAPFTSIVDISALDGTDGFKIKGENTNDQFGTSVATAGDINGDGFDDLLIGAPSALHIDNTYGAAYVLFGKSAAFSSTVKASTLDGKTGFKIYALNRDDQLGYSVSTAGDMNGDGLSDILLGSPEGSSDGSTPGSAYVIFGKRKGYTATFDLTKLNGTNGFTLKGENIADGAGASVASAGDFNGDGFDDILVGAPNSRTNGNGSGTSYLVFGRPSGFSSTLQLSKINGTTGFKFLGAIGGGGSSGSSLSSAGDVNDDGFTDLLIGAPFASLTEGSGPGATYVLFGSGTSHDVPLSKAGGKTVTFTDVDGDLVKVTTSKGKVTADMLTFGPDGGLFLVDLTVGGTFKDGANLTFSVKKIAGGDGIINVGAIIATGIKLGTVKVTGNLGQIDVGGDPHKSAIKSLTVGSLGDNGTSMQPEGTLNPFVSDITGNLPKFTIKGDVNLATINISGALGKITISGNFIGSGALSLSQLQGLAALGHGVIAPLSGGITLANSGINAGSIGTLTVKQSINSAAVNSSGNIGSVSVSGSVNKGAIVAAGSLKVVKVFGSITSDDPNTPSVIAALASVPNSKPKSAIAINTFTVKGNVLNAEILVGYNKQFEATNSDASIGTLTVKGNWQASSLAVGVADVTHDGFGQNDLPIFAGIDGTGTDATPKIISRIASLTIGTLLTAPAQGSAAPNDFYGITAQSIVKAKINGIKLTLDKVAKDNLAIGTTTDFRLVEV